MSVKLTDTTKFINASAGVGSAGLGIIANASGLLDTTFLPTTVQLKTAYAAKGDILVGTAANTDTNLSVGSNGQALVADSTKATGLKYQTGNLGTYASGQTSRAASAGTGTQTIAHGMGVVPKMVKITANRQSSAAGPNAAATSSTGSASPTTGTCTYFTCLAGSSYGNGPAWSCWQDASHVLNCYVSDGASHTGISIATVSAVDATNITLNFTTHDNPTNSQALLIQWESYA